jgi:uracil-DNA glycosylase
MVENLKKEYFNCSKCPVLVDYRSQVVFGSGSFESKVIFIGEAPGAKEDKNGIPFCGMSGKILDSLLESAGFDRKEIFITNTILCRPPKNRNPAKDELKNCNLRLYKLIDLMKPKVIVTIGNFATKQIIGMGEIKKIRGQIFEKEVGGNCFKVIPVVHPAGYIYSGRNAELFDLMKQDFKLIAKLIGVDGKKQKELSDY